MSRKKQPRKLVFVDAFAGCGGLSLGLFQAGMKGRFAIEHDRFAFETLNAERVEFRADARNEKSIAAMKSIGCKTEGILRNNMPLLEGGRRDSIILSILKTEWNTTVKENLKMKL